METYNVYRYFKKAGKRRKLILKRVSLEIAQLHCNSPLTQRKNGDSKDYFDGYVNT